MPDSNSVLLVLEFEVLQGSLVMSVAPQGSNGPEGDNRDILQLEFEGKPLDSDDDSADEVLLFLSAGDFPLEFFEESARVV